MINSKPAWTLSRFGSPSSQAPHNMLLSEGAGAHVSFSWRDPWSEGKAHARPRTEPPGRMQKPGASRIKAASWLNPTRPVPPDWRWGERFSIAGTHAWLVSATAKLDA